MAEAPAPSVSSAAGLGESELGEEEDPSSLIQLIYRNKGLMTLKDPRLPDFGELVSLRILSLAHNELTDISLLAELPVLEELNVSHNQLVDLRPCGSLTTLRVLLASNNQISTVEGLEPLQALSRLSLFMNQLESLDDVLVVLQSLPQLAHLDLSGNPCCADPSQQHGLIKALPGLKEFDGEPLKTVDRELALEFFACAEELGLQERPTTAAKRPSTAPVAKRSPFAPPNRLPGAPPLPPRKPRTPETPRSGSADDRIRSPRRILRMSASGTFANSPSLDLVDPLAAPEIDRNDLHGSVQRLTSQVEALQLRIQTTQVECENLRRQIHELRTAEPPLGVLELQETLAALETENRGMHQKAEENRRLQEQLALYQGELARRFPERLGSGGRPRTARPRTAASAAEAVLDLASRISSSVEDPRALNRRLKNELEIERQRASELRAAACSAVLGRRIDTQK